MKTLYVHIGTEKTGSTSIQRFLGKNASWLYAHNLFSPLAFCAEEGHHYRLVDYITAKGQSDVNNKTNDSIDEYTEKQLSMFKDELNNASDYADTCILSSEHFFSKLNTEDQVKRLHNFLSMHFDDIKYIIYIRDPVWHVSSWISTRLKNGIAVPRLYLPGDPEVLKRVCNMEKLKLWVNAVGSEKMIFRKYSKSRWVKGELISDFCHIVKPSLNPNVKIPRVKRANESLSLTAMRYLYFINKSNDFKVSVRDRLELALFLAEHFNDGSRFIPSLQERDSYQEFYSDTSDWICKNFFPNEEQLWPQENELYRNESIDLTEEIYVDPVCIDLIKELWIKFSRASSRVRAAKVALS